MSRIELVLPRNLLASELSSQMLRTPVLPSSQYLLEPPSPTFPNEESCGCMKEDVRLKLDKNVEFYLRIPLMHSCHVQLWCVVPGAPRFDIPFVSDQQASIAGVQRSVCSLTSCLSSLMLKSVESGIVVSSLLLDLSWWSTISSSMFNI